MCLSTWAKWWLLKSPSIYPMLVQLFYDISSDNASLNVGREIEQLCRNNPQQTTVSSLS